MAHYESNEPYERITVGNGALVGGALGLAAYGGVFGVSKYKYNNFDNHADNKAAALREKRRDAMSGARVKKQKVPEQTRSIADKYRKGQATMDDVHQDYKSRVKKKVQPNIDQAQGYHRQIREQWGNRNWREMKKSDMAYPKYMKGWKGAGMGLLAAGSGAVLGSAAALTATKIPVNRDEV